MPATSKAWATRLSTRPFAASPRAAAPDQLRPVLRTDLSTHTAACVVSPAPVPPRVRFPLRPPAVPLPTSTPSRTQSASNPPVTCVLLSRTVTIFHVSVLGSTPSVCPRFFLLYGAARSRTLSKRRCAGLQRTGTS